ncbi:hypothetical protein HDU84_001897 [Entophlyctis sp. JEL0112]|nr:hypothetical protein HDU84_001897 [Entophlyctis sp. JEL0112]
MSAGKATASGRPFSMGHEFAVYSYVGTKKRASEYPGDLLASLEEFAKKNPAMDTEWFTRTTGLSSTDVPARITDTISATEAAGHHVYKCIQNGWFAVPRAVTHPAYASVQARFSDPEFTVLELGCCYGTDARRMVTDGLPASRLTVSDLHSAYFDIGQRVLFAGAEDLLAGAHKWFGDLAVVGAALDAGLDGKFDAVSAQAMLHVMSAQQSSAFLSEIFLCLKSGRSAVLFGTCVGTQAAGGQEWSATPTKGMPGRVEAARFLHSSKSLAAVLSNIGYENISVEEHIRSSAGGESGEMVRLTFSAYKP